MFSAKTYTARRHELRTKIGSGIILLPGNSLSPNNYPNNAYYFRQDSSFRYYFGLNVPSVVGVIDADTGEEALYGDDFTVEDIIWTGPQPTLREMGAGAGVTATFPMAELENGCAGRSPWAAGSTTCRPTAGKPSSSCRRCWASNPRCCTTTSRWT